MTPGRYVSDNFKVYFLRNFFFGLDDSVYRINMPVLFNTTVFRNVRVT